jgi:hypothetical protein
MEMMNMNRDLMAKAFNEWMRRYIEEPSRFMREFESVSKFEKEEAEGKEPTYGDSCASYLTKIAEGLA